MPQLASILLRARHLGRAGTGRRVQVKAVWDPYNLPRHNKNIPPAGTGMG